MKDTKHYAAVVTASFIWGLFAFVLKPLAGWPPQDILFNRVFLSAILIVLPGVLFRRGGAWASDLGDFYPFCLGDFRSGTWLVLQALGGGFLLTGNWFLFIFMSLNTVSIKAASMAYLGVSDPDDGVIFLFTSSGAVECCGSGGRSG